MLGIPRQARLLYAVELVEDRAPLIGGDTNAMINDTNLKAVRIVQRARPDLDGRLFGRVFERILDQNWSALARSGRDPSAQAAGRGNVKCDGAIPRLSGEVQPVKHSGERILERVPFFLWRRRHLPPGVRGRADC